MLKPKLIAPRAVWYRREVVEQSAADDSCLDEDVAGPDAGLGKAGVVTALYQWPVPPTRSANANRVRNRAPHGSCWGWTLRAGSGHVSTWPA